MLHRSLARCMRSWARLLQKRARLTATSCAADIR